MYIYSRIMVMDVASYLAVRDRSDLHVVIDSVSYYHWVMLHLQLTLVYGGLLIPDYECLLHCC